MFDLNEYTEPQILGLDCTVEFISWGGDPEDISALAYCDECSEKLERMHRNWETEDRKDAQERAKLRRIEKEEYESSRRSTEAFWLGLTPLEFEEAAAALFADLGFTVSTTAASNDGGIDLILKKNTEREAVQCKYSITPSSVLQIREFYGAITAAGISHGYFLSKSGGTREALKFIEQLDNLELWDMKKIIDVAIRVQKTRTETRRV